MGLLFKSQDVLLYVGLGVVMITWFIKGFVGLQVDLLGVFDNVFELIYVFKEIVGGDVMGSDEGFLGDVVEDISNGSFVLAFENIDME